MTVLSPLRILVVDDDAFARTTTRQALRATGQSDILMAADGPTALIVLESYKPNLVLCDIGMEPMSGLEFLQTLRRSENPALRETAVVMLTSNAEAPIVHRAIELGISGYIVKPVAPARLYAQLAQLARQA